MILDRLHTTEGRLLRFIRGDRDGREQFGSQSAFMKESGLVLSSLPAARHMLV